MTVTTSSAPTVTTDVIPDKIKIDPRKKKEDAVLQRLKRKQQYN